MHPRLHLVLRLKGKRTEIGEHSVQIRLLDEQSVEILGGNGSVTFAEPPAGVTEIEAGGGFLFHLPFPPRGPHRVRITTPGGGKTAGPAPGGPPPPRPGPRRQRDRPT